VRSLNRPATLAFGSGSTYSSLTSDRDGGNDAPVAPASGLTRVQSMPHIAALNTDGSGTAPNAAEVASFVGLRISGETQEIGDRAVGIVALFLEGNTFALQAFPVEQVIDALSGSNEILISLLNHPFVDADENQAEDVAPSHGTAPPRLNEDEPVHEKGNGHPASV